MSDMNAGFVVPAIMLLFIIFGLGLIFWLSHIANVKKARMLENFIRSYEQHVEEGNFIAATREILDSMTAIKLKSLSYLERAELYLKIAKAMVENGSHDIVIVCTSIISILLPETISIQGLKGEEERNKCREEALTIEKISEKELVSGAAKATLLRVQEQWANHPDKINQLIESSLK